RFAGRSGTQEAWFLGRFSAFSRDLTEADFLTVSGSGAGHRADLFCGWVGHPDANKWLVLSLFRFVAAQDYPPPQPPPDFWFRQKQAREQGLAPRDSWERPGSAVSNWRLRNYDARDELPQWLVGIKASRQLPDDLVSPLSADGTLRLDARRF